jgi:hypothetical protein
MTVETMRRCFRLIISALVLATALAGVGGAFAAKMNHACIEMGMVDCPADHGDDGAALPVCSDVLCGPSQATLPQFQPFVDAALWAFAPSLIPSDDIERGRLRSPPALRPPIA